MSSEWQPLIQNNSSVKVNINKKSQNSKEDPKESFEIIPVSEGVHDENQETSEVQKTNVSGKFINLETAGLRRSSRNQKNSTLPPNFFMAKIINGASGFTQEAIMTLKTNKNAI